MDDASLGLGRDTIMDAALAARHGVRYVHLAAFAIDLDRLMEAAEDAELDLPFGFEVFMMEMSLLGLLSARGEDEEESQNDDESDDESEDDLALIEDAAVSIFERLDPDEEPPLGASLLFAIRDALLRGELPERLESLFTGWSSGPDELGAQLDPLFDDPDLEAAAIARVCLGVELHPPLAPPTREALEAMIDLEEPAEARADITDNAREPSTAPDDQGEPQ